MNLSDVGDKLSHEIAQASTQADLPNQAMVSRGELTRDHILRSCVLEIANRDLARKHVPRKT